MHKLEGQEMNFEKLCRKEMLKIIKKTTVDFSLVASII